MPAAAAAPAAAKIGRTELLVEILTVLELVTGFSAITKDDRLHVLPRLGLMTNAANQEVAGTLNARPKIQAVGLVVTTDDVRASKTVSALRDRCWDKVPPAKRS